MDPILIGYTLTSRPSPCYTSTLDAMFEGDIHGPYSFAPIVIIQCLLIFALNYGTRLKRLTSLPTHTRTHQAITSLTRFECFLGYPIRIPLSDGSKARQGASTYRPHIQAYDSRHSRRDPWHVSIHCHLDPSRLPIAASHISTHHKASLRTGLFSCPMVGQSHG